MGTPETLLALLRWCLAAPSGTSIPAASVAEMLAPLVDGDLSERVEEAATREPQLDEPWRVRLWEVHPECRLDVKEAAEALGRSPSWIYKRTGPNRDGPRLPHRKLDGVLTFTAGELRAWIRDHEESVHEGEFWTPRPHLEETR